MTTAAAPSPQAGGGIEDTVNDFWHSRPRRTRRGRKIAGVAAGIGQRYGIDPVIVRVALIATTVLGGFGVLLYLLGWLFLPDERDRVSAAEALFGKGRSSTPTHVTILLCIALFPSIGWAFGDWWSSPTGVLLTVLLLFGLFALHRTRGGVNRPTAPVRTAAAPASFSAQQSTQQPAAASAKESTYQPPAGVWDPLGAAPLGWQLTGEDPVPAEPSGAAGTGSGGPPVRGSGRRGTVMTLGATLVTAAVGITLTTVGAAWFTPVHIIGLTLGVLGIGMVATSFTGSGRGLLVLAVPLAAAGMLLNSQMFAGFPSGGMGELDARPTSVSEVQDVYERSAGSVNIDLTALPDDAGPVETAVRVGMGEAVVTVPAGADVTFVCDSNVGDVTCLGKTAEGVGVESVHGTSPGEGDGPEITLDVSSNMGSVEVRREG